MLLQHLDWHINQDRDYEVACERCEIWCEVASADRLRVLCNALVYDKRKDGAKGRSLREDLPEFNLKCGDRVEPHAACCDIGKIEDIRNFPCHVLFWRKGEETLTTHRCILFDQPGRPAIGVTPTKTIAIDVMHSLFLGPLLTWGQIVLWRLLLAGVWGLFEINNEQRLKSAILACRNELHHWYRSDAGTHSRVSNISQKMIGTANKPHLKLKAMETFGFAQFLLHCLVRYRAAIPNADALHTAGLVVIDLVKLMQNSPTRLADGVAQDRNPQKQNKPWAQVLRGWVV